MASDQKEYLNYLSVDPVRDKFDLEVAKERERQMVKWGEQNHPDGTGGAFNEFAAKETRFICDMAFKGGYGNWYYILDEEVKEAFAESAPDRLREELIQVAAVCKAWVECIDRRTK